MVKAFVCNNIAENCYVLSSNGEAAIIDCGAYSDRHWEPIKQYIESESLTLRYVLQTHAHFDHVYGLCFVERDYGLHPFLHQADEVLYEHTNEATMAILGISFPNPLPPIGGYLFDGQKLQLGDVEIEVIHTPGHTPGGVSLYVEKESILFSGDTLFAGSVGRSDFPGGDFDTEISSIRERLLTLPDLTVVYPGHGPQTTIQHEKSCNPYF